MGHAEGHESRDPRQRPGEDEQAGDDVFTASEWASEAGSHDGESIAVSLRLVRHVEP